MSVEITCDDFAKNPHLSQQTELTIEDVRTTLVVTLCSNQSTGFQWSETAAISASGILEQVDHEFVPLEQTGVTGGSGQEVWTFKALKQGTSTISMEYSRPWEGGEKGEWTYALTVTVE
jgi:inhibitor of cysteine peptidase